MARFFNALLGWKLVNLNADATDFPAADLGDDALRIALQITNQDKPAKIEDARKKAVAHRLGARFDRLIIFFLLAKKPGMPGGFAQPVDGPAIKTWDLADLLKQMMSLDLSALKAAWEVLEKEVSSLGSQYGPFHTLPPRPEGFVGREVDLGKLRVLNPASGAVLTGLRGMGGIGKTALALVLAHEWAARFPDAQIFLDARGTQAEPPGAGDLLAQVIQTFHPTAKLPDDETKLKGIYHDVLGRKKVLILLDNARDAAQAAPLIPPAGCGLIVTSRHSFMLGTTAPHDVGRLPDDEAVELLRKYHPALGATDAAALVKLCAGLPLALRLAGAHLALDATERRGTPDVAAYLRALGGGRLATLDADASDAGEITISETLRLSEARLPDAEREAWRKLGVFAASFDARAATVIAGADETTLARFVRRSLLEREGANRYKLHDLAAEYARTQLPDTVCNDLHLAHARLYTAVGEKAESLYQQGDAVGGLALFDQERAQIEAAYTWLAAGDNESSVRQLGILVNAVVFTAGLRFHPQQRIGWLESQIRAARRVRDRKMEGIALGNLGQTYFVSGDVRTAIEFHKLRLAIARELGDRLAEGIAFGNLGLAFGSLGDAPKAIEYHEQALAIAREISDQRGEAYALGGLGYTHASLGDVCRGIKYHEQALAVVRKIGDRREEGSILGNLGGAYFRLSEVRKAIEFYEQALLIVREIGDRRGEGNALTSLGNANAVLGAARKAIEFYGQALVIAQEIGDQRGEGNALWNAALANDSLGNRAEAIARAKAALPIYEVIEDPNATKVRAKLAEWRGGV